MSTGAAIGAVFSVDCSAGLMTSHVLSFWKKTGLLALCSALIFSFILFDTRPV